MSIEFDYEYQPDFIVLVPTITLSRGRCENPNCEASHGLIVSLDWLSISLQMIFIHERD